MAEEKNALISAINDLFSKVDLKDVTAESEGFKALDEGYYLCEVETAELTTSKTSGLPMAAFRFKVVEDGHAVTINDGGYATLTDLPKTKNQKMFIYYVFKDETSVRRFVKDMLKFEGETVGEPILSKEYFVNSELIEDALDILIGMNIYIQVSKTKNKETDEESTWQNLISWKRAKVLELPV